METEQPTSDRTLIKWLGISFAVGMMFYLALRYEVVPFLFMKTGFRSALDFVEGRYSYLQSVDGRSGDYYIAGCVGFVVMSFGFASGLLGMYFRIYDKHVRRRNLASFKSSFFWTFPFSALVIYFVFLMGIGPAGAAKISLGGLFFFPYFMPWAILCGLFSGGLLGMSVLLIADRLSFIGGDE